MKLSRIAVIILVLTAAVWPRAGITAEAFPYGRELLLDAPPMPPSKRIPSITVAADGRAVLDLWCRNVDARAELSEGVIAIVPDVLPQDLGQRPLPTMMGPGQCSEARMQADETLLTALMQVTGWRAAGGEAVVLTGGGQPLRFRSATN